MEPEKFVETEPGAIVWTPAERIDGDESEPLRPVEPLAKSQVVAVSKRWATPTFSTESAGDLSGGFSPVQR